MPIFRYTFKKMLVSPSTWITLMISIIFLMTPLLVTTEMSQNYLSINAFKIISFYFLALCLVIFIAIKATQIFRSEINDGTLLILVSKPISRSRIWAEKWLSFQAILVMYCFLTIFISTTPVAFLASNFKEVFPYMWLLFGTALLFDLIISSIALLLSLVLNSIAFIATMIGMAAVSPILGSTVDTFITTFPSQYFQTSQAFIIYQKLKTTLNKPELDWVKDSYIKNNPQDINEEINKLMNYVYVSFGKGSEYHTHQYFDAVKEQEALKGVIDGSHPIVNVDKVLASHIVNVSNLFRQFQTQSYEELMTGQEIIPSPLWKEFHYTTVEYNVTYLTVLNYPISETEYNNTQSILSKKQMLRSFNVFYQLYYIWIGISNNSNPAFSSAMDYTLNNDPYLVPYQKITDDTYKVNLDSQQKKKILNFAALVSVYTMLGIGLLGVSWFVFNRRDFA